MTRVVWLTDLHLNFPPHTLVERFYHHLQAQQPAAVLVGGDIAEWPDCLGYLEQLDDHLDCPIYFVLGNHDYYFSSIAKVREATRRLCRKRAQLIYLSEWEPLELAPGVGLVGHDGWADGRLGDYARSVVSMQDHRLIEELAGRTKIGRRPILWRLGDEAADHIRRVLPPALERWEQVVLLTHVPPFREACWHEGRISDDHWAPHFTCEAMGRAIYEIMRDHPTRRLLVLCGHTHGAGECRPVENVRVITAGAVYGDPSIARVLEF